AAPSRAPAARRSPWRTQAPYPPPAKNPPEPAPASRQTDSWPPPSRRARPSPRLAWPEPRAPIGRTPALKCVCSTAALAARVAPQDERGRRAQSGKEAAWRPIDAPVDVNECRVPDSHRQAHGLVERRRTRLDRSRQANIRKGAPSAASHRREPLA